MGDMMTFPASVEEFMEQYKMTDTEHVYSNGTEYVPIYRMKQWFEHCRNQQSPTIDAVPVVRGRECKYSRINHLMKKDILSCENIDVCGEEYLFERNPNDFCSYGKREGGSDND